MKEFRRSRKKKKSKPQLEWWCLLFAVFSSYTNSLAPHFSSAGPVI